LPQLEPHDNAALAADSMKNFSMRTLFKAIVYKVGGGQCNKGISSPNSLESVILPGSHNKIKVTQNIFMNNFCFSLFLVFFNIYRNIHSFG
jgi:hypothetical protein